MSSTDQSSDSKKRESHAKEDPSKRPRFDAGQTTNESRFKNAGDGKNAKFQPRKEKLQQNDAKFHYGNYDRYYGKRAISTGLTNEQKVNDVRSSEFNDPRLKQFKQEWFENKKVLDIGCNVGLMTMAIAYRFGPSSIVGLDIDGDLIRAAKNILRKKFGPTESGTNSATNSNVKGQGMKNQGKSLEDEMDRLTDREKSNVFNRVRFETGNYVLSDDSLLDCVRPEYDVIMALSLTKWIHLNWGDDGMKRFFRRIYRHLNPGGILLLEPQPWSTYRKRSAITPEIAKNYSNIQFKPDRFRPFLMSEEIGFESNEVINKVECEAKGFHRPIYLFRKPIVDERSATNEGTTKEPDSNGGETSKTEEHGDGDCAAAKEPNDDNAPVSEDP